MLEWGWALILVSGALGNLVNATVYYPEPHYSVGASTAVFGALGLVTGVGLWGASRQRRQVWSMPRWILPAVSGLTLLGWLGVADGPVDVGAHFSGFACGATLGVFAARLRVRLEEYGRLAGWLPIVAIAGSWLVAYWMRS